MVNARGVTGRVLALRALEVLPTALEGRSYHLEYGACPLC